MAFTVGLEALQAKRADDEARELAEIEKEKSKHEAEKIAIDALANSKSEIQDGVKLDLSKDAKDTNEKVDK